MTFIASAHSRSGEGYITSIRSGKHELVVDEPEAHGGKDAGPSPFDLLLSGLAACTSITLKMYAERKGWTLPPLRVDLRLLDEGGKRRIERVITIEGPLPEEQRARLAEIAEKTPVTRAVREGNAIETRFAT